jgi:hypothetical protein
MVIVTSLAGAAPRGATKADPGQALGFWPSWLSGPVMWGTVAALVALWILGKWLLGRPARVRPLDSAGRVVGVVGRMGSGKSYFAVRTAYRQLAAGAHVASNFTMRPEALGQGGTWRRFSGWDDLALLHGDFEERHNGKWVSVDPWEPERGERKLVRRLVVIVDEAQLLASSIEAMKLSFTAQKVMGNLRKLGIDMYWISQHESRVAKRLRDSTNEIFVCRSRKSRGKLFFEAGCWEPEHVRKPAKMLYRTRYRFDPAIARLYDTLEVIGPQSEAELAAGVGEKVTAVEGKCDECGGEWPGGVHVAGCKGRRSPQSVKTVKTRREDPLPAWARSRTGSGGRSASGA